MTILYALSFVLFLCAAVLVKCWFIITRQDRKIQIGHDLCMLMSESVQFWHKECQRLEGKQPKRNAKGQFTCK